MSFKPTKFYNCIENDSNLKRREKNLFRVLCGFWVANGCKNIDLAPYPTVMAARGKHIRVESGHVTLARKLHYAREDAITPAIKGLVEKGYISYFPGTGVAGQQKNISQFSVFHLHIPVHYALPSKITKIPDHVALAMAKTTLVRIAGVAVEDAELLIANGLTNKAISAAKASPTIANYQKIAQAKRRLQANEIKVSA